MKPENLRNEVALLRGEISSLQNEADLAHQRLERVNTKLAELLGQLRVAAQHAHIGAPTDVLGFVRRLEGALGQELEASVELLPPFIAPWNQEAESVDAETINVSELPARLEAAADSHGIDGGALRLLDVFARAGEMTLVVGPNASAAIAAYAHCVSAASIVSVSVDASTIGLDDLWRTPGTHRPTALAYAWNDARNDSTSIRLVCLRNIHGAPARRWLSSLQEAVRAKGWPRNLLVVATMDDPRLAEESPDEGNSELARRIVALRPKMSDAPGKAGLNAAFGTAQFSTRLAADNVTAKMADLPVDWTMFLASASVTVQDVARIARVAAIAARTYGEEFSMTLRPWADVAVVGDRANVGNLPPALADGYAALKRFEPYDMH